MNYLLDTNICIYFMKNTYPQLSERFLSYDPARLFLSSITVFELEYGAAKSKWGERTRINLAMFLAPFTILPFDANEAGICGALRARLEQTGTPIGPYDLQIAATALSYDLCLITHNINEFGRVPHLTTEDWIQ